MPFKSPAWRKCMFLNLNYTYHFISLRWETTITSTTAVQAEAGLDSGPHFYSSLSPVVPDLLWLWPWVTGGSQGGFIPSSQWALYQQCKNMDLMYTLQNGYICTLIGSPYLTGGFCYLPTSSSDLCVGSVSLLITWLWFVLQIIDSQLACPVVLVTVFLVDRDQNDPTIPWEYTRKADDSVIWAICLLWPERELKTVTFLMSCTLLWRLFENCFAGMLLNWPSRYDMHYTLAFHF